MKIEDNVINELFDQLLKSSNYNERYKKIKRFNSKSKYLK